MNAVRISAAKECPFYLTNWDASTVQTGFSKKSSFMTMDHIRRNIVPVPKQQFISHGEADSSAVESCKAINAGIHALHMRKKRSVTPEIPCHDALVGIAV